MKATSAALKAHMAGSVTTLANLWTVTRRDAQVFGFTDHDRDIAFGGLTYVARTGFTPSEIANTGALNVDNLEIDGFFDSAALTQPDLEAGVWDGARLRVSRVNYVDLTMGEDVQLVGELGQFSARDGVYKAEARGLSDRLQRVVTRLFLPSCDADLGDARCTVNLAALTVTGAVTVANTRQQFTTNLVAASGTFDYGVLTWTSGTNTGRAMEVKLHAAAGVITLQLPMPSDVAVGHAFSIVPGCDKTPTECRVRYSNIVNFRGFPHVPGLDQILKPGGA